MFGSQFVTQLCVAAPAAVGYLEGERIGIDTAIASFDQGDVGGLQTVLTKMQEETKAVDAKSGHFLY